MDQPHVTIAIATRCRPERLLRCLELIEKNTRYPHYDVVVVVDADPDTVELLRGRPCRVVHNETQQECVKTTNIGARQCTGDFFVYLNDDMEAAPGWLTHAMYCFQERFADRCGLVSFKDGMQNGKVACAGLVSKSLLDRLGGTLLNEEYIHYFADEEMTAIVRAMGCYAYCPEAEVAHVHFSDGGALMDGVYEESMALWERDKELFYQRQARGFDLPADMRKG